MVGKLFLLLLLVLFSGGLLFAQGSKSPEAGQAYNAGNDLAKSRNYKGAIPKYLAAIKADNNFPKANYMLALCYGNTSQYKKAEASYKNAIKLDSKFEIAYPISQEAPSW